MPAKIGHERIRRPGSRAASARCQIAQGRLDPPPCSELVQALVETHIVRNPCADGDVQ